MLAEATGAMNDLTGEELQAAIAAECRARHWRVLSAKRLQKRLEKLREARALPPARKSHVAGRRGSIGLYPPETVEAYVRCESIRRAAKGKRVRSWRAIETARNMEAIRAWLEAPHQTAPPRSAIIAVLDNATGIFRRHPLVAPLVPFIEAPLADEMSDFEPLYTAIENVKDGIGATDARANLMDALLQALTLRDADGTTAIDDDVLEPLRDQLGDLWRAFGPALPDLGRDGLINRIIIDPRRLVEEIDDDELRAAAPTVTRFFAAVERLSQQHSFVGRLARSWATPPAFAKEGPLITTFAVWFTSLIRSNEWVVAGTIVLIASCERQLPGRLAQAAALTAALNTAAQTLEDGAALLHKGTRTRSLPT